MTKPIERHFHVAWVTTLAAVVVLTLPLDPWVAVWATAMAYLAQSTFAFFLGAEIVAGGVQDGYDGTMTDWVRRKFPRWFRMVLAFWFPLVVFWRYPDALHLNAIISAYLVAWLPWHYWPKQGPVDRFWKWVGKVTGVEA